MKRKLLHLITLIIISLISKTETTNQTSRKAANKYNACICGSRPARKMKKLQVGVQVQAFAFSSYEISCCARQYIGVGNEDFTVTWKFQSETESISSFKAKPGCHNQVLWSHKVDSEESGNYTCRILNDKGKIFEKVIIFNVTEDVKRSSLPYIYNSTQEVYSKLESTAVLRCTFYVPMVLSPLSTISWKKYSENTNEYHDVKSIHLQNTQMKLVKNGNNYYTTELKFANLTELHFGNYSCRINTMSGIVFENISFINDEHPASKRQRRWRMILCCSFVLFLIFCLGFWICFRFRYVILFKWKKILAGFKAQTDASHDIFIIHGNRASRWIFELLVPHLEKEWKYDCFVPDRDTIAGEDLNHSICNKIKNSRVVIIVVTDCLFRSQWCSFATSQAVLKSLEECSRAITIIIEENINEVNISKDVHSLVNIIRLMKKIYCPVSLTQQFFEDDSKEEEKIVANDQKIEKGSEDDCEHVKIDLSPVLQHHHFFSLNGSENDCEHHKRDFCSFLQHHHVFPENLMKTDLGNLKNSVSSPDILPIFLTDLSRTPVIFSIPASPSFSISVLSTNYFSLEKKKKKKNSTKFSNFQRYASVQIFSDAIFDDLKYSKNLFEQNTFLKMEDKKARDILTSNKIGKILESEEIISQNLHSEKHDENISQTMKKTSRNITENSNTSKISSKHHNNAHICKTPNKTKNWRNFFFESSDALFWQRLRIHLPVKN